MKLYLAGPDVFRADAGQWAADARALCAAAGHEALIPLDCGESTAAGIYRNNLRLIESADAVLANLNPFRGAEPDSGTCVEVGYALARGKPVVGYMDQVVPLRRRLAADGGCRDADGRRVEDFGLPLNLMLAVPVKIVQGGIAAALEALAADGRQTAELMR